MKKVLIVDDAATVRRYYRTILEGFGFEVDEAFNGLEALEKASSSTYDLFVVDINMPKLDGLSLVRKLRQKKNLKQAPVIIVSTESEEKDRQKAFACGVNLYMVKPVKPEEFSIYCKLLTGVHYE